MNFDVSALVSTINGLHAGHVGYAIGRNEDGDIVGKVWRPERVPPSEVRLLDCSGYSRYVLIRSVIDNISSMRGGTRSQRSWLERQGYEDIDYPTNAPRGDDHVRMAFRDREGRRVGHVWFVINGYTYESTTRNNRNGPTSFLWSERTEEAHHFFDLGRAPGFGLIRAIQHQFLPAALRGLARIS